MRELLKKNPNLYPYLLYIKHSYLDLKKCVYDFIYKVQYLNNLKKTKINTNNITVSNVIDNLLSDVFKYILTKCNLIYWGKYRFRYIFLFFEDYNDMSVLTEKLNDILINSYTVEVYKGEKRYIINKFNKKKLLKKIHGFDYIRVYKIYKNCYGVEEFGSEISLEIHYWSYDGQNYISNSLKGIQNRLSKKNLNEVVDTKIGNHYVVKQIKELDLIDKYRSKREVKFVDIVFTWTEYDDEFKKDLYKYINKNKQSSSTVINRYRSFDELKYSLRSIEKYLYGYRNIYIVVNYHKPKWLSLSSKRVKIITHKELFPDNKVLPTFNSHAIETVLHHIDDLSEHYLYFNDDVILSTPMMVSDFFPEKGYINIFPSNSTYIPFEENNIQKMPVDSASINTRTLLNRIQLGMAFYKFKHTPLPQIKTVLYKLERLFYKEILKTRNSKFRTFTDISLTSSLLFNYLYFNKKAYVKNIRYSYINIGNIHDIKLLQKKIILPISIRPNIICLNDTDLKYNYNEHYKLIHKVMEQLFYHNSSYEIGK